MNRQAGFTLVELLVSLVVGMIILLSAFKALDAFSVASATVTTRTDNTQRARLEMDGLIRALRSEVCTGPGGSSVLAGTTTSVTFVTDLSDGTVPPEKRTVTYNAATRRLSEARYRATSTTRPLTFPASPTSYGPTLSNVEPIDSATPIFDFFAYDASADPATATLDLGNTIAAGDLIKISRIVVSFKVGPAVGVRDRATAASLQDEVDLRTVDPSAPVPLPLCS